MGSGQWPVIRHFSFFHHLRLFPLDGGESRA